MVPFFAGALALGLAACGGDDSGTGGSGAAPKYTLENVCAQIAPELCAARENCCLSSGAYDETACISFETAQCDKNVADVKAGLMTFDGDSIDACTVALKPYADKCYLTITDFYDAAADLAPCSKVFAGKLKEGSVCERDAQCESSLSDKEFVSCDNTTKKCKTTRFLPNGAACALSTTASEFCDKDLYCDADLLSMKGTCKPATPVGGACTPGPGGFNLQCGLGYYCDGTTKVCTVAKGKDEPCALLLECQSLSCTGGVCKGPDPLYSKEQCTGMP